MELEVELSKSFTEIIRENFRKIFGVYFTAAAVGISGTTGCGATASEYIYIYIYLGMKTAPAVNIDSVVRNTTTAWID